MMELVDLPSGTLTFLLTDVEGSTRLWEVAREAMAVALPRSLEIVEKVASASGGTLPVEQGEGDSRLAVFGRATDALEAAVAIQRAMTEESWPEGIALRVRIALHAGDARLRDERTYGGSVVHRAARLRALARGGQVLVSRAVNDLVADELPPGVKLADLGHHRLRDLSRPEQVFELQHPDISLVEGGLRSLNAVSHNLPSAVSSFVGRVAELAQLADLLAVHRLVTVTGPGGCGKTRLTLEVAADAAAERPDGIWLVELAGLIDPDLVPDTILATVDVGEVAGVGAVDRLATFLHGRRALLVLDNCEHLVDAVAAAAHRLLQACPDLRIVATSREPLGVTGEVVWRVPPMTLDEQHGGDAVALFLERAREVRSNFALTEPNREAVVAVCTRLDGVPLAIELAAARVRSMSVTQIATGLDDRFRLLAGGSRTALARQRTLEASVQWSYDLLDPPERAVLRRLAVFQGAFDLAAAEQVASGGEVDSLAVLDLLGRLVDKSLVQADESPAGDVRYRLLDTIRHFGRDRLAEAGEADHVLAAHLGWIQGFAAAVDPALHRADLDALARVDDHLNDVRAALAWASSDPQRASSALDVVGALGFSWSLRTRFREGIEWCKRALAAAPDQATAPIGLRARCLLVNATLYGENPELAVREAADLATDAAAVGLTVIEARARNVIGFATAYADPTTGLPLLDEAIALAHESGDDWTIAETHQSRAYAHIFRGDLRASLTDLDVTREIAARWQHGYFLGWEGVARASTLRVKGDLAGALVTARAAQAAGRRIEDSHVDAGATAVICSTLVECGRPDDASTEITAAEGRFHRRPGYLTGPMVTLARAFVLTYEEEEGATETAENVVQQGDAIGLPWLSLFGLLMLTTSRRRSGDLAGAAAALDTADERIASGFRFHAPDTLLQRAVLQRAAGEPDNAEETAHNALLTAWEMGFHRTAALALEELAHVTSSASPAEAARLLGASAAARHTMGLVPDPEQRRWIDDTRAALVDRLGDTATAAVEEGERLSLEEAVAYARRARGERGRPVAGWGSLTPTECQVVDLVVAGLNNPQIGDRLLMSRSTVKAHLTHVYTKLGVANRAELAAVAARHAT